MPVLPFLSPLLFRRCKRSRSVTCISPSFVTAATASDKPAGNEDVKFINDRIDDLRNLISSRTLPSIPSVQGLPSIETLPSLSALQRSVALSTLSALSPTSLDHLCPLPTEPSFDPILALNLATYAFRAYHEPPSSSYRETFTTPVGDRHFLQTDFVYPSAEHIAAKATGVFLLKFSLLDGYITVRINDATVRDIHKIGHVSIPRIVHLSHSVDDLLHLYFYPSDNRNPSMPTHTATLSLKAIVDTAFQTQQQASRLPLTITFDPIDYATHRIDYFQEFLLPTALQLPFFSGARQVAPQNPNQDLKITVDASFLPFKERDSSAAGSNPLVPEEKGDIYTVPEENWGVSEALEALGDAIQEAADEETEAERSLTLLERRKRDAVAFILRTQLPERTMPTPTDWSRLAAAANVLIGRITAIHGNSKKLDANASPCLFVDSGATDTEVWFFRDIRHKSLVVSFRGTEQVSWQDFFTDAQMFLQRWTPGDDIDLTVSVKNTVGLAEFFPSVVGTSEMTEKMADDVSAVHYGFLRAYMSVRDAVDRGISVLTEGENQYTVLFTGHSLGGALATIAAGDYAARRGGQVCCMSFGAPKVGNFNFTRRFNELVPNAFRIVNDSDLVSRMPRSLRGGRAVDRYKHSGRTVLVNDFGDCWIEGENDELLMEAKSSVTNPFRERYNDVKELIQHEKEQWEQLLSGISVKHHMEDSYFTAIQQVVRCTAELQDGISDDRIISS